ncbi:MAG: excinuclease ABC subunit UvrC [Nitrospinae bacterium]|nr:excinuclease ABC subunit UvrC [Nitrospinota bacterium]
MEDRFAHLRPFLEQLTQSPGVYRMKDSRGKTLYIGKAKNLRNRVRSYFQESADHSARIQRMTALVREVEITVTASELEALILEDNLVKTEQPPYNVMLRDDKNYPYLKLTMEETFPRLVVARRAAKDGGMYFGPYVSARATRDVLRLADKIFGLRKSKDDLDGKPPRRPCLNFQMGRCLAPCAAKVTPEEYRKEVDEVILFLKGRNEELMASIGQRMREASERQWFEVAARYRDQLDALRRLTERQSITSAGMSDEDVIASWEEAGRCVIRLFRVRRGKLIADETFQFGALERLDRGEALAAFIRQFYSGQMEIPPEVLVNAEPDGMAALMELLSARRGAKVVIATPERGRKRKLVEMAERNARLALTTELESAAGKGEALEEIGSSLGMAAPETIEAYDISNTGGASCVGAVVVFKNGVPSKGDYRTYSIKSVGGPDDYASLGEVIRRRFRRIADKGAAMADLLLIDGGKGQLGAVARAFADIGVAPPRIISVAKGAQRENLATDEFYALTPADMAERVELAPAGRLLLQRIRDEAHRFAISRHTRARDRELTRSVLDDIPGVGPKRKKALLRAFGSVARARAASVEDIQSALSISEALARKIHEGL